MQRPKRFLTYSFKNPKRSDTDFAEKGYDDHHSTKNGDVSGSKPWSSVVFSLCAITHTTPESTITAELAP